MKVKKYVVDSMPDALQKIRTELGKDAVIINTKEIRVGGFLGMFTKKKVEVVAATDSNPESAATSRPRTPPVSAASNARLSNPLPVTEERKSEPEFLRPTPPSYSTPPRMAPTAVELAPNSTGITTATVMTAARDDALLQEMKQMREMMQLLTSGQAGSITANVPNLPAPFENIRKRLVANDVREDIAQRIVEQSMEKMDEESLSELTQQTAIQQVTLVITSILTVRPIEPIRQDARIVHFVGPTGVGKTTTIAKLAAEQTLKHRKSIGLITSDTYRIAAIEQLRTYASILNVPIEVVFSAFDLQKALEKLSDREMILMDTAGRNFRNEMAVSELYSLLRTEEKKDTFLVLSLSMKYNDMKAVTENFQRFGVEKVLFTKADETATFGSVLNLLFDYPLSLSYVTHGQNVPDDIQMADASQIANELVGDQYDE